MVLASGGGRHRDQFGKRREHGEHADPDDEKTVNNTRWTSTITFSNSIHESDAEHGIFTFAVLI